MSATTNQNLVNIDYLARDYTKLRQLMLERVAARFGENYQPHIADLGMAILEVLAYVADHHSYFQDAIATEAYLGTARLRASVKRHAKLLNYVVHDGCNARVWVNVAVKSQLILAKKTKILTGLPEYPTVIDPKNLKEETWDVVECFETMQEKVLYTEHNLLGICIDENLTYVKPNNLLKQGACKVSIVGDKNFLKPGDVILFELQGQEIFTSDKQSTEGMYQFLSHAVSITSVSKQKDKTIITWSKEDALPYDVLVGDQYGNTYCVIKANIVLADHGRTVERQLKLKSSLFQDYYILSLDEDQPLCWVNGLPDFESSAKAQVTTDPLTALPVLSLFDQNKQLWQVQQYLLDSSPKSANFVVDREDDGRLHIRLASNRLDQYTADQQFIVTGYRLGGGKHGNVSPGALQHVVGGNDYAQIIEKISNPISADGGHDPEILEKAKHFASLVIHQRKSCVMTSDYVQFLKSQDEVFDCFVEQKWFGNQLVILVYILKNSYRDLETGFCDALLKKLQQRYQINQTVYIVPAQIVDLALTIRIKLKSINDSYRVKQILLEKLIEDKQAFFAWQNFSLGKPLYTSQMIGQIMNVPGVIDVKLVKALCGSQDCTDNAVIQVYPKSVLRLTADKLTVEYTY